LINSKSSAYFGTDKLSNISHMRAEHAAWSNPVSYSFTSDCSTALSMTNIQNYIARSNS